MVVENVKGAQPWVGRANWHFGSYYLWGDVPALMPIAQKRGSKIPGQNWSNFTNPSEGQKNAGGSWFSQANNTASGHARNPVHALAKEYSVDDDGTKGFTPNGEPLGQNMLGRKHASGSKARKAASAMIAKIPLPLSQHIARVYYPRLQHV